VNPLSVITLCSGLVFAVCGLLIKFFPPRNINSLYGYRTGSAMRNPETWEIANQFAAKLMIQLGLLLFVVGLLTFILPPSPFTGLLAGILVVLLTAFMQFYFTEKHLRKHFDKHGNRRK
jgi:uncharacterized membrane protein